MISRLDPRLWAVVALVAVLAYFGGQWQENRVSTARRDLADGLARAQLAAATARASAAEKKLVEDHAAIDKERKKEKDDAKSTIDALRADVRSGVVSLSIATRALRAGAAGGDPAAGYIETRSELVPEAAIGLIDIAADGNDAVLDLNACIDKYEAVRRSAKAQ